MSNYYICVVEVLVIMTVGATGESEIESQKKRSDSSLYDFVSQIVAEQMGRKKIHEEIQGMRNELTAIKKFIQEFKGIRNELADAKKELKANKNSKVAFSASLPTKTSGTSSGLNFSKIVSNIGGGYNGSDGVFYCPKDGLYLFTVTVTVEGYKNWRYVAASVIHNNDQLAHVYQHGSGISFQTASLTLALNLRIGDRIWLKGAGIRYYTGSYFTGILVEQ